MARYSPAVREFSSTLSLPTRMSLRFAAISLTTGVIITHGPHHPAQKSTTHRPLAICFAKSASVSDTGWPFVEPAISGVLHRAQTAFCPLPSSGTLFACPQLGHFVIMRGEIAKSVQYDRRMPDPRLAALLSRANNAPYDLAAVAAEKCFEEGIAGKPELRVYGDYEGVSVTCGKFLRLLAVDPALRRRGIGSALFADAVARGARVVAAEPGNYFTPGVFADDAESLAFFRNRGCGETTSTQNLITSELPSEIPPNVQRVSDQSRERVLGFIRSEFGAIWRFETSRAFVNDPPTLFFVEHDGKVAGFAAHDANNRNLGFFGPAGVAKSLRGRGLGRQLLLASLADLRRLGHDRVVIPWTDSIDFYRKACGASVAHRFLTLVYSAP